MSPELRAFLQSWIAWVECGAPDREPYYRADGLCMAVFFHAPMAMVDHLQKELQYLFENDGLSVNFPFSQELFFQHAALGAMHTCPKRLAWVRQKLQENPL